MPDRDGYLHEDEVMIGGKVWTVRIAPAGQYLCEIDDCDDTATTELAADNDGCVGWQCVCDRHLRAMIDE